MHNKKGFLLAECMLVLTLAAFLTMLSFSLTHLFERLTIRAEVSLLLNTIEAQRSVAIINEKDSTIMLSKEQNNYSYDTVTHAFTHATAFVYPPHSYGPPSLPTMLIQRPISFVDNKIICFQTGALSSGVLYIGSLAQGCFYALSSAISEWGVLRLYSYDGNKWRKEGV